MPDFWTILKSNSSLPFGDVWEHLNNQEGGGPGGSLILFNGLEVEVEDRCFEVEVDFSAMEVEIVDELEVEIETAEFEV